jgi:hypothetical protein
MRALAYGIWQVLGLSYSIAWFGYVLVATHRQTAAQVCLSTQHSALSTLSTQQHSTFSTVSALQPALSIQHSARSPQLGVSAHIQHSALSRWAPGLGAERSALPARQQGSAFGLQPQRSAFGIRRSAFGVRRSAFRRS